MKGLTRILGSLILLAILARVIDWSQLGQTLTTVDGRLFLMALGILTISQVVSSWRWQLLARVLHFAGSLKRFVAYYFIGMLFNLILPTSVGGDMVRAWYLVRSEPDSADSRGMAAFLTVFAERFSGVLVLLLLVAVSTLFCPVALPRWLVGCLAGIAAASVTGLLGLALLIYLADKRDQLPVGGVLGRSLRFLFGLRSVARLVEMVRQYGTHLDTVGWALALSVLVQLGSVLQFGLLARSIGLELPWLYLGVVVPLVSLLTLLPISINGMGLRAAGIVVLLQPLGVPSTQAVMLSALGFTLVVLISLVGGLSCYLFGRFPRFAPVADAPGTPGEQDASGTDTEIPGRECKQSMKTLSVVIPIKDEIDNLRPLHQQLHQALDPLLGGTLQSYEIIVVDDGSTDGSFALLEDLAAGDERLKVVRLRRNYGQTPALQAGIDHSSGDVLVTMDGDRQNDPADIPMLLAKLDEGYDMVLGEREKRKDSFLIRKLPSRMANWLIRKVTGVQIRDMGCTIRALRRELAEVLPLYGELHRFVPVLAQQQGARMTQVLVRHHPRVAGKTHYTLSRTFRVLLDLITITFLDRYLTRPMHALGLAGLAAMGLGLVSLLGTVWMKYFHTPAVFMTGNPLLLLSVMLELIGFQLICMGLIGELLTRTYFESQGKSAYVVRSTLNMAPPAERKAA